MGKGDPMPKHKVKTKKRPSKKLHLADNDRLLSELQRMIEGGHDKAHIAQSLTSWYLDHKSWTKKQLDYVKVLVKMPKVKKVVKAKKYHLYAIASKSEVKLGFSCDISKRIKTFQTARAEILTCDWRYYVGREEAEAKKQEKRLHRFCKKHHIRGEWYKPECMILVKQFGVKEKIERDFKQEEADEQIINGIPENF